LADQKNPHIFTKGIVAADETTDSTTHAKVYDKSQINALVAYECNETSGGVTYIQNLTYTANYNSAQKLSQGWGNDTFFFSANLSIAADGCEGSAGVNVNFSVSVYYPPAVWDALPASLMANLVTDPSTGAKIGPVQIVQNNVTVIKSITNNDPTFGIVELLAQTLDPFTMNVSGLLAATGTDIVFHLKGIEGSSQGPLGGKGYPPGLAFQVNMDYSLLSQANSVICAGEKEYCCADGVDCCCDEDSQGAKCSDSCEAATTDPSIQCLDPPLCKSRCVPFGGAAACSASTGEQTKCSDSKNPINQKTYFASDCQKFKLGLRNFTGGRVDLFPSDGAQGKKPYSMDLLQMFYSELCDANHGSNRDTKDCPGLDKGGAWLFGDATNDDPSQGGKGYVKIGDFSHCDTFFHSIFRHLGFWGTFGVCLLLAAIAGLGGFAGFKYYKKRKETQNYSVNDDSIYHDVGSVVR